jgi:hypothetical protein
MTLPDLPPSLLPPGLPLPSVPAATSVVAAPGAGPGHWAGAPSAALAHGTWWLAYRLRRPVDRGRGLAVVLARSSDGVRFEPVGHVRAASFGAASLERPALVARPDGGWRLYVSCATPGSKHWRIDALDADTVEELPAAAPATVLPGDALTGVKDPVVTVDAAGWHMWVCCHPLDLPGEEDRMVSRYASSPDGLAWTVGGPRLAPPLSGWARRGTRVTAVLPGPRRALLFDGRASAEENWCERTGVALLDADGRYRPVGDAPVVASPHHRGTLRYMDVVPLPGGGRRLYFEAARPDGAHDLSTQLIPAP